MQLSELEELAKQSFAAKAEPNWHLNQRVLRLCLSHFQDLRDKGYLNSDDEIINASILMAVEME